MREVNLRGIPFFLHDDKDDLSNAIAGNRDFWEADILDYIKDNYPTHNTILDIGANVGNHSVYFANFLEYKCIMAFEPEGTNYGLLAINMAQYKNIGLARMAVSNHTGKVGFQKHNTNYGAHAVNEDNPDIEEYVNCVSIDRIALSHVTLMKIDVEFHEPQVIEGATDTIIRCHPLILIEDVNVEYHRSLYPLGYKIEKDWTHHSTYLWKWEG